MFNPITRRVAIALLATTVLTPAFAGEVPGPEPVPFRNVRAVIELFTSQGCSSCPPADVVLKDYAAKDDIIALSLPVDYWDYIGWKDTLESPKNTERQRAYAKSLGSGSIYTPQAVVNGVTHAVGSNRMELERAIDKSETTFARRRIPTRRRRTEKSGMGFALHEHDRRWLALFNGFGFGEMGCRSLYR